MTTADGWTVTTDRDGRRCYTRPDGHIVDGNGAGRMRWTVRYPDGDYGMTDTRREAFAWAGGPPAAPAPARREPAPAVREIVITEIDGADLATLARMAAWAVANDRPLRIAQHTDGRAIVKAGEACWTAPIGRRFPRT